MIDFFSKLMSIFVLIVFMSLVGKTQCPQLIWSDEFDGTSLDLSKWSFQEGDGCNLSQDLCGWGNNELQWYTTQNLSLSEGIATITARRESIGGRDYTSSRIRSLNKGDIRYGRIESRMKMPKGQGLWPAFWMLSSEEVYGPWPQSGEIDIMEYRGDKLNETHGTLHFGNPWPNNSSTTKIFTLAEGAFNEDFHVYAVEWTNQDIKWLVDGYLYSTKTRNDLGGLRWPFDQDFHILLNMAVGGSFSGNPDGSTIFPQSLEIDYVRVFDMTPQPYLSGPQIASYKEERVIYRLSELPDNSNIEWIVPESAELVEGQGSSAIVLNWGERGGIVKAMISNECGTSEHQIAVRVEGPLAAETILENFDSPERITRGTTSGKFSDNQDNPTPNEINDSTLCGKYERDGSTLFDVIFYETSDITDGAQYISSEKRLVMDVLTDAPAGTKILIQLENKNRSQPSNYPVGRHSRYEISTTKQNEWERLSFPLLDRPDPGVSHQAIDQLVVLFAPNSNNSSTYYFDNFQIFSQVTTAISKVDYGLEIVPNPVKNEMGISLKTGQLIKRIEVIDNAGRIVLKDSSIRQPNLKVDMTGYSPGIYYVRILLGNGDMVLDRFIKH